MVKSQNPDANRFIKELKMKKQFIIPTWALLVMILILASTSVSLVVALTINNLTAEQFSLFAGQVSDSDFVIDNISTDFVSSNKVRVKLTIRNSDASTHSANVTVTMLNSTGDMISIGGVDMVESQLTGDISGSGTTDLTFNFEAIALVSEYESNFIEIRQLS